MKNLYENAMLLITAALVGAGCSVLTSTGLLDQTHTNAVAMQITPKVGRGALQENKQTHEVMDLANNDAHANDSVRLDCRTRTIISEATNDNHHPCFRKNAVYVIGHS